MRINYPNSYAHFVKVDLHLHTPADPEKSFHPKEVNEESIRRYIHELKEKNIKVGALTDHNAFHREWFESLAKEAEKEGIFLLPGVEIEVEDGKRGLHLLIIVHPKDVDKLEKLVPALLGLNGKVKQRLEDFLQHLESQPIDFLAICAHVDNSKGICKELGWGRIEELIKNGTIGQKILAFQDINSSSAQTLENCINRLKTETGKNYTLPAFISASDPSNFDEIGGRYTWMKLSDPPCFESLVLALKTPELRILPQGESPPAYDYFQIIRFHCERGEFLDGFDVCFSPELNTFIGPRGTGKSAVLETLRYALELPYYTDDEKVRRKFVEAVLGSGGKVSIWLKNPENIIYRVEVNYGETPRIIRLRDGQEEVLSLSRVKAIFGEKPPILFGQKELYYVSAEEEGYLEKLFDDLVGDPLKTQKKKTEEIALQIKDIIAEIFKFRAQIEKREELESELKAIEHEIKNYEDLGVAEKLEKEAKYRLEESRLRKAGELIRELEEDFREFEENSNFKLKQLSAIKGEINTDLFEALKEITLELEEKWEQAAVQIRESFSRWKKEFRTISETWKSRRREIAEELAKIRQTIQTSLSKERYLELIQNRDRILPVLKELRRFEEVLKEKENRLNILLNDLKDSWDKEYSLRREKANELNQILGEHVRWKVDFKAKKESFSAFLKDILTGTRIKKDFFDRLAKEVKDGIELFRNMETPEKLKQFAEEKRLSETHLEKIRNFLFSDKNILFKILTYRVPDEVTFSLKVGETFLPRHRLSVGQKCTAVLLTLLVGFNSPLIIDQPEDDLDNTIVYEGLVKTLWKLKGKRQIIFATHNANIPVNGDAELVIALGSPDNDRIKINNAGAIDWPDIRKEIVEVMEGGKEAFKKREERYLWIE